MGIEMVIFCSKDASTKVVLIMPDFHKIYSLSLLFGSSSAVIQYGARFWPLTRASMICSGNMILQPSLWALRDLGKMSRKYEFHDEFRLIRHRVFEFSPLLFYFTYFYTASIYLRVFIILSAYLMLLYHAIPHFTLTFLLRRAWSASSHRAISIFVYIFTADTRGRYFIYTMQIFYH